MCVLLVKPDPQCLHTVDVVDWLRLSSNRLSLMDPSSLLSTFSSEDGNRSGFQNRIIFVVLDD
jgi:hypothetical protein